MFRSRHNKSESTSSPKRGEKDNMLSPIMELRQCVSKLNILQDQICKSLKQRIGIISSPNTSGSDSNVKLTSKGQMGDNENEFFESKFVSFSAKEEEEIIELFRRIAELVVHGEQRAAFEDTSSSPQNDTETIYHANDIFEYFCEANVLGTIVNIVTGWTLFAENENSSINFGGTDDDICRGNDQLNVSDDINNETKHKNYKILPPITVATQAVQSVSILIQNVSRVTSLYFILSNNKVNDLINLPLKQYTEAEQNKYSDNSNDDSKNIGKRRLATKSQSAEMSELTTLFISFLKSLAMRMNPETLQFYLTYPMQNTNVVDFSTIQFPLYARALEFCNPEEDTFVRVTAMNICLNTLRLATNGEPLSMERSQSIQQSLSTKSNEESERPDKKFSPDGSSLHLNEALPFRERLVIAHYVCQPCHVQALTSATFTRIGQLCSSLEETIRNMERIDWELSKLPESTDDENRQHKTNALQRDRLEIVKQCHNVAADFQDEVFLLEDILAVGLVPLNEQIIEMMFAGVVYPLVLQPLQIYQKLGNNNTKTSHVADISLAKASFFVIGSIYHYISHKPFLHLLLTALFHPFAPDASTSLIQTNSPSIIYKCSNGDIQIKTDKLQQVNTLQCYLFGRRENTDTTNMAGAKLMNECTYVLSSALAALFSKTESMSQKLRSNSYRSSFLACLSGTDGMAILQPFAVYAIDAVLATIQADVLKNIMFGTNISPEWEISSQHNETASHLSRANSTINGADNNMVQIVASICRSLMMSTVSSNGLWRLNFNPVASHAICCVVLMDKSAQSTAMKLVEHRKIESASFLTQTPSRLKKKSSQSNKSESQSSKQISLDDDIKMDRIFFDPICDGDKSAVENLVRIHNESSLDDTAYISVAKDGSMNDFCKLICTDPSVIDNRGTEDVSYHYAANSAVAFLQLDAFTNLLKNDFDTTEFQQGKGYLGVSAISRLVKDCDQGENKDDNILLAPLSPHFTSLLFDKDKLPSDDSDIPQTGSIVELVGKTAFPCVYEVTKETNPLFTDGEASVISDGIKWQSLWMVLIEKYMILAEPISKDSGGHGRVLTSYPLCCIAAERDDSVDILQSTTPARRLLLSYYSSDTKPPKLFVIDATTDQDPIVDNNKVRIIRSVMDLWFEDTNAAAKALKALTSKITKARSIRGHKIMEILEEDGRLRFQSMLIK